MHQAAFITACVALSLALPLLLAGLAWLGTIEPGQEAPPPEPLDYLLFGGTIRWALVLAMNWPRRPGARRLIYFGLLLALLAAFAFSRAGLSAREIFPP